MQTSLHEVLCYIHGKSLDCAISVAPLFKYFSLRSTDYTSPEAPDLVSAMGEGKVTNINSKDEWTSVHQKAGDKAVCARSHLH